jgi:hypothetical protein
MTKRNSEINNLVFTKLSDYAAGLFTFDEIVKFQSTFKKIVEEYRSSPYVMLSTGIYLDRLESFKQWLPDLIAEKNRVTPLLISNMLKGDMFSESVYSAICKASGSENLFLDIYTILRDPIFESKYKSYGMNGSAEAKVNAEYWLASEEAVQIFASNNHGNDALCYANQLLGIANLYVDCSSA